MKINFFTLILIILTIFFSCEKQTINNSSTNTDLIFSTDTITFDTVFTSIGSITKTLTVYNKNNFDLLTNISIKGYSAAHFRMNIDGIAGNNQSNIEIPANDSIFIFLEVTINPNSNNTPYILTDSLIFTTGTKKQSVNLIAWGQNAHFHTANTYEDIINGNDTTRFYYHLIDCTIPWTNDKPHVIYGYAIVNPGQTLTINQGCNIHLHKNSGIIVGNPFSIESGGTIKVNGTLGNEVTFQGDRLDTWYNEIPGQWDKIWLIPGSFDNEINYAIIKNGNIGIHADTVFNNNPTVEINNTIIDNMSGIGILGQGANINVNNTLISRCGQYTVACNIGGIYNFMHCTFANYWDYSNRKTPSILLNNFYEGANGNIYVRDLQEVNFTNCIIQGSLSTELSFQENELGMFNYKFDHCMIKIDPNQNTNNTSYINSIINQEVKFNDPYGNDFHLTQSSPAINTGKPNISTHPALNNDLEGNIREISSPDIGVYEYQN